MMPPSKSPQTSAQAGQRRCASDAQVMKTYISPSIQVTEGTLMKYQNMFGLGIKNAGIILQDTQTNLWINV